MNTHKNIDISVVRNYIKSSSLTYSFIDGPHGFTVPETFYELEIDNRKTIHFYCIVPIYAEEIDLKLQKGTDALLDRFNFFNVSEIVDPVRRKTVKHPAGLFKPEKRYNITTNSHIN
jgi:hypothetical protein